MANELILIVEDNEKSREPVRETPRSTPIGVTAFLDGGRHALDRA